MVTPKKYSEIIYELMASKGIGKRQIASTMAKILDIKYQSAKQKLDDKRSITLNEIKKIHGYFNLSFEKTKNHNALFIMKDMHVRCNVEVESYPVKEIIPDENYATKKHQLYIVTSPVTNSDDELFKVKKMVFMPPPKVAILDNDTEILELLTTVSNRYGIEAQTFQNTDDLFDNIITNTFDCYIIDWLLDFNMTSESIIKAIRSKNETVPILLLTGQLNQREKEVGNAIVNYGVELLEKPTRTVILSSVLISYLFY